MAYRHDPDLEFLSNLSSEELNDLVYLLTHDKSGEIRLTEELTMNARYKKYYPEHSMYWEDIAAELQCYGGNTIATLFRSGKGILYKEILTDVCDKLKVNYNKNSSVELIEEALLMKILEDSIDKMSQEEIQELASNIGMKSTSIVTPGMLLGSFQTIFKMGGFKSYQLTVIIANLVLKALIGRGLSFAANATLTRSMAILTGPIGWVITGGWTLLDIASAAYRVTIPGVIQIACLRRLSAVKN